jgi:transposase InsO family protein
LKTKDEVFSKFMEFKALIENLSERKIKTLRSDNRGEYTSKEFGNFYKDVGIKRELTTPYNPQQNGVAEPVLPEAPPPPPRSGLRSSLRASSLRKLGRKLTSGFKNALPAQRLIFLFF